MEYRRVSGQEVDIESIERKKDIKKQMDELHQYYMPNRFHDGRVSVEQL